MLRKADGALFGNNCEAEARSVFEKSHLFTKDELITSLEYHLEYIQEEALTENARREKLELYQQFLETIKKCRLPDLCSNDWKYYQYEFVGNGIVLALCTADEIEFDKEELNQLSILDYKELLKVNCKYVSTKEFALIQGVKEETVVRWINAGKLKDAKLEEDRWLIPSVQDKPRRWMVFTDYIVEPGLHLEEFPFVQFCDNVYIREADEKAMYICLFSNYSNDFREEMILKKEDVERLEFLLISSGKAELSGRIQYMPNIK